MGQHDHTGLHGLDLVNPDGSIAYSTTEVSWSQVGFFVAPANKETSIDLPGAGGLELATMQFPVYMNDMEGIAVKAHEVTISGTKITASGGEAASSILVLGR